MSAMCDECGNIAEYVIEVVNGRGQQVDDGYYCPSCNLVRQGELDEMLRDYLVRAVDGATSRLRGMTHAR